MKEEIARLNVTLDSNTQNLQRDYVDLRQVYEEKVKENQELIKKQKTQKEHIFRINQDLMAANAELASKSREKNTVIMSEQQWKNLYEAVKKDKQEVLSKLCDLREKYDSMKIMMEGKIKE